MLDQLDLVHMNGRVYDPLVGRFLSADPLLQDPQNGQSYNRYSYVMNNPTNMTDPTGFASCDPADRVAHQAILAGAIHQVCSRSSILRMLTYDLCRWINLGR